MQERLSADAERFLSFLGSERRSSALTVKSYARVMDKALRVLALNCPELKSWQEIGQDEMRVISREVHYDAAAKRHESPPVAHDLYALSSFFKFLMQKGELKQNPLDLIRVPKVKKPLPRVLTLNEIDRLT